MALSLSPVQQQIVESRGKNMVVSASAGSGKTTVLVERLCSLVIQDRIPVNRILAMTFTEDAAGEMKDRLKQRLLKEDTNDPYIKEQLTLLETASISTIHGFCLNVLQKNYYRLGLPYSMVNHIDNDILAASAMNQAFDKAVASLDPARYAKLRMYMESFGKDEKDLKKSILHFLEIARTKPDPQAWMQGCLTEAEKTEEYFLDYFRMRIRVLKEIFWQMEDEVQRIEFKKASAQEEWRILFEKKAERIMECEQALEGGNYQLFGKLFVEYLENTGKFTPKINKVDFSLLQKDSRKMEADISSLLFYQGEFDEADRLVHPLMETYVELASQLEDNYLAEKKKLEIIDFSDMEQYANRLLSIPEIADEYKKKFEVILVDEYQDTNDLQETIIQKVASENNLFLVGDLKQSIYGFRQARPALMQAHMARKDDLHEVLYMDENYRSKSNIIDFNNRFFERLMNTEGLPSQFSAEDRAVPGTESQKALPQKPVRFLFSQYGVQEEGEEKVSLVKARSEHQKNRYDWIARDIEKKVREEGLQYRDIAILSRASTNHQEIKEALEAWNIPSISRLKKGFYTNQAVQIVLSALKIIVNPRNDVALMSVLCSPIGKRKQAEVIRASLHREDGQSLYDALRFHPMMKFYDEMASWQNLPLSEIIEKVYQINSFYYSSTTEQDKTNLDLLLEKAAQAENEMDLESFISQASLEEDFNKTGEAVPFGREADVVRISTIHSSKGLQYKTVYLLLEDQNRILDLGDPIHLDADLGLSFKAVSENYQSTFPTRSHIAFETKEFMEDQEEKMRLLYVAATRAENELVFVGTIKNLEEYETPMDRQAILANKGFISWLIHTAHDHPEMGLEMDEVTALVERPILKNQKNRYKKMETYRHPVRILTSATASGAKKNLSWRPVSFQVNSNMERGTLFHEMAAKLPYPYRKEDILRFTGRQGYEASEHDLSQLMSLNDQPQFAGWMRQKHAFELPYSVLDESNPGSYIHGFMDFVAFDPDVIHIVDFKTDSVFDMDVLQKNYGVQLRTYQKAMQEIYPDKKVRIYLYSFHLKELREIV